MKKILFLLLSTIAMYGQVPADATPLENIQITNNTQSTTATKVNVQEANGTINTISKSDLVNVVEVNDVPSLPLVGEVGKIYVVKNVNKIYRWNGTFYQELAGSDISGKEDIANKQNSLAIDGTGTKYPTVDAVNSGLATKAPISSVHNPVTLGTANGLSLSTQQLSLGLASSGVTGALSGTDWDTFNNKVNGTGTNNFLTKWSSTNTVNASGAWRETSNRLANASDNGSSDFQVTGQIDLKSKNTQGDGGQLGAELLTTGTGDASWTGTSFATGYTHVAGSVTTLTSTLAPVINNLYQVAYTVTGRTAGSFTIAFGGATTAGITSSSAVGHRASTTGTLVITPTSDFNGTIVLSIKQITAGTASFVFRDNGGTLRNELRVSGINNTASGVYALQNNTTGINNTANGASALLNNTTGTSNTANGVVALQNNTTGNFNTASGLGALQNNTTGGSNTANGASALQNNTTGGGNTASGLGALQYNTAGSSNTANGANAGRFISNGATSLTVAINSTFLGANTKALADNSTNETVVGYNAIGDGNNTVSIGNTSIVSSRLRGRILQGNVADNLVDSGQFSGNVLATGFKTASGTASQFLKANGSVDSNTYLTSASLPTVDQTIIDGSTNAVSGNAVFDGLASKANTGVAFNSNQYLEHIVLYGNSITVGQGASPKSVYSWNNIIPQIFQTKVDNYAIAGTTLVKFFNGDNSGIDRLTTITPLNSSTMRCYVSGIGVNDMNNVNGTYNQANFIAAYEQLIDRLITVQGWTASKIYLWFPYTSNPNSATMNTTVQGIATAKGVNFINVYNSMVSNGGNALLLDGTHPNNQGHKVITDAIAAALPGTKYDYTQFNQDVSITGMLTVGNGISGGDLVNGLEIKPTGTGVVSNGKISLYGSVLFKGTPVTSTGTYDILTRNSSTGVVEKVLSSAYATTAFVTGADANVVHKTGNETISGQKSFSLTGKIDMQTDNAFPAISVTALGSNGLAAAQFINNSSAPYSSALRLQRSSSGGVGNRTLDVSNQSPIGIGIFSDAISGGVSISSQSGNGDSYISNITYGGTGRNYVGRNNGTETYSVDKTGSVTATQYKISALNTAPASATATGTTGEIRITAGFIYVCTATNTWVRTALATW